MSGIMYTFTAAVALSLLWSVQCQNATTTEAATTAVPTTTQPATTPATTAGTTTTATTTIATTTPVEVTTAPITTVTNETATTAATVTTAGPAVTVGNNTVSTDSATTVSIATTLPSNTTTSDATTTAPPNSTVSTTTQLTTTINVTTAGPTPNSTISTASTTPSPTTTAVTNTTTASSTTAESSTTTASSTTGPTTPSTPTVTAQPSTTPASTTAPQTATDSDNSSVILGVSVTMFFLVVIIFLIVLYIYCNNKDIPCMPRRQDETMNLVPMRQSTKKGKYAVGHMWISRVSFESSYRRNIADDNKGYREEYRAIKSESKEHFQGSDPKHQAKNRYENVLPYDETRVVLSGDHHYINANFVPGYLAEKKFIACQGPKDTTDDDFWQMMWEQKSSVIVMVTNLVENNKLKCHQYWPNDLEPGSMKKYGNVKVTFVESKIRTFYTYRLFKIIQFDEPARMVHQLHYTAWPDFGVPKSAAELLLFRRRVMEYNPPHSGPIVVHCSAGVGRTGTFILVDAAIEQVDAEGKVDLFSFLCKMRKYRMMMIQTDAQYAFAHLAVLEHIKYGDTEVSTKDFPQQVDKLGHMAEDSEDTIIEEQFDKLVQIPLLKNELSSGRQSIKKNRLLQIIPYDTNRVTIPRKPGQERSDYINASFIDGFQEKRAYIATQGPLDGTIEDFWSMVWHYQVKYVVMLTALVEKGQDACARYWPENVGDTEQHGKVTVKFESQRTDNDVMDYTTREIVLSHLDSTETERTLNQYHYHGWPEVGQPSDVEGLLEIITLVNGSSNPTRPIVVHCSSGGGRTGIFCCLSILAERCEAEGLIDVFQTVKKLRDQRPHIIQTKEQLEFCYSTMMHHLGSNDMLDSATLTSDLDFDSNIGLPNGNMSPSSGQLKNGNGYVNLAMEADISGSMNNHLDLDSQNEDKSSRSDAEAAETTQHPVQPSEDSLMTEDETKNQKTESSNDSNEGSEFEILVDKHGDVI